MDAIIEFLLLFHISGNVAFKFILNLKSPSSYAVLVDKYPLCCLFLCRYWSSLCVYTHNGESLLIHSFIHSIQTWLLNIFYVHNVEILLMDKKTITVSTLSENNEKQEKKHKVHSEAKQILVTLSLFWAIIPKN